MNEVMSFLKQTINKEDTVILGLSGGPDSMALFHLLCTLKKEIPFTLVCAHINHHLRKEALEEEKFVKEYTLNQHCIFEKKDLEWQKKTNIEAQARKKRYVFFEELIKKYHAKYLITAHHGDDLTETILMHINRGSSFKGYAGFRRKTVYKDYTLLRPLITVTKEEIENYLKSENIPYKLDESNTSFSYTRNRYRSLLPFLKKENPKSHAKFLKFSEELFLIEDYLEKMTQSALTKVYVFGKVNLREWNRLDFIIKKRVLESILKEEYQDDIDKINDRHVKQIFTLCTSKKPNQEIHLPLSKTLVKEYNTLYFCNKENQKREEYILEDHLVWSSNERFEKLKSTDEKSNFILRLDQKEITFPIKVRTRKNCDVMEIKNLNGTKKVKDIFINEKIPKRKRDTYPIVVDGHDQVIWIPGVKKSKFDKNSHEFYDIIYKYVSEENVDEK